MRRRRALVDRTDGVSFEFPDWRFNLRTSNTEPLIRLNVEARGSVDLMQRQDRRVAGAAEVAGRGRGGSLRMPWPRHPKAQRRHSGLQRRGGAADVVRAAVSGARCARIAYEIVFVNDGSRDRSVALLRQQFSAPRRMHTRVVLFHANFGQHSAVMAGLAYARGEYVVTLDADLQNPPEEIGKLVGKLDEGYDYVGTIRQQRQDSLWRRMLLQGASTRSASWITPVRITDQGCMMRGYARSVVDGAQPDPRSQHVHSRRWRRCMPCSPIEVPIAHEERFAGRSKYSLYSLIRLNFDLITGFSVVPLQLFSMVGMAVSILSALLFVLLVRAPHHRRLRKRKGCSPCSASCSS